MEEKGLLWILVALAVVMLGIGFFTMAAISHNKDAIENQKVSVTTDTSTQDAKILELTNAVNGLSTEVHTTAATSSNASQETSGTNGYVLTESEFEDQAQEDEAMSLADESMNSRDFKKAVFEALEDHGVSIDDYKDITSIKVIDSDVRVRRNTGEVEYKIKVYYFVDGDDEETESARLDEFTVEVDSLVYDDDFEDAEVDESYMDNLSILKVYD